MLCSSGCNGKCSNSNMTRIVYALLLAINSIISWIMLTPWAIKKLEHLTMDYMQIRCKGNDCFGFVAVRYLYRISAAC